MDETNVSESLLKNFTKTCELNTQVPFREHSKDEIMTVIALCGDYGSGKTTTANILTGPQKNTKVSVYGTMDEVLLNILFGFPLIVDNKIPNEPNISFINNTEIKDKIWGLTREEAKFSLLNIFRKKLDPNFNFSNEKKEYILIDKYFSSDYIEINLADPLKRAASIIFDIPHEILLAETPETRETREKIQVEFPITKKMTGRKCLEYLGTEMMRKEFNDSFWIKLWKENCLSFKKFKIITSDVRFENEFKQAEEINARIICLIRNGQDFPILTEERKQKEHPASWSYLEYISKTNYPVIKLLNNESIENLKKEIFRIFN